MPKITVTESTQVLTFRTAEVELSIAKDDGGLRSLRRVGGPNLIGHGDHQAAVDIKVGSDSTWLANRVFVRYLRYSTVEHGDSVEVIIVIGIGPLMISDTFQITGTLIARSIRVQNVSEDQIRLRGLRLEIPWARIGETDTCQFAAPGNSVRARLPLAVAAAQRRGVLPRRFFAPGLRYGRTIEPAPVAGPGLLVLHEPHSGETLLCWYSSADSIATPQIEGNGVAITLIHDVRAAEWLAAAATCVIGTQYLLLVRESWPAALQAYQRTAALLLPPSGSLAADWPRDAAIYEVHAAQHGGFHGLQLALESLQEFGVTTVCLLPIWVFHTPAGAFWDEDWEGSGNPYLLTDVAQIDPTLGTAADLRALSDAIHARGMRLIVDLPLVACAPQSRYVAEHPEWFCCDGSGAFSESAIAPGGCLFDWAQPELQRFWREQAVAQAQAYAFDGYRAQIAREPTENWGRTQHASASPYYALQVVEQIRQELRNFNPAAAMFHVLGGPMVTVSADLVCDEQVHLHFTHLALNRLSPAELCTWLEDDAVVRAVPLPRAVFTESYQTWQFNPLANGMRGSILSRMMFAGMVLCGFVPMIRHGQEQDVDVQRLLQARALHPALRRGSVDYRSVQCDHLQVLTVLRVDGASHVIGLLNIAAHTYTVTLNLPASVLGLIADDCAIDDLLHAQPLDHNDYQITANDDSFVLRMTLAPFSAYGLVVRPAAQPKPKPEARSQESEARVPVAS